MGASDGGIVRVFFIEGLYIGLVGLGLGLAKGLFSCLLIWRYGLPLDPDVYYIQKLPIVVRPSEIASVAAATTAFSGRQDGLEALEVDRLDGVDAVEHLSGLEEALDLARVD